eukprot:gene30666-18987_t
MVIASFTASSAQPAGWAASLASSPIQFIIEGPPDCGMTLPYDGGDPKMVVLADAQVDRWYEIAVGLDWTAGVVKEAESSKPLNENEEGMEPTGDLGASRAADGHDWNAVMTRMKPRQGPASPANSVQPQVVTITGKPVSFKNVPHAGRGDSAPLRRPAAKGGGGARATE